MYYYTYVLYIYINILLPICIYYILGGDVGCSSHKFDPAGDSPDGTMITILLYNGVSVCFPKPSVFYDPPRTSAHPIDRSPGVGFGGGGRKHEPIFGQTAVALVVLLCYYYYY